ncbi:hypothetical protein [Tateyamaria sp.]|uniref:hypothetical protein n=1 Tax=Tateyamaria sp. TaxID=1929288 RepID=UPI003B21515C
MIRLRAPGSGGFTRLAEKSLKGGGSSARSGAPATPNATAQAKTKYFMQLLTLPERFFDRLPGQLSQKTAHKTSQRPLEHGDLATFAGSFGFVA